MEEWSNWMYDHGHLDPLLDNEDLQVIVKNGRIMRGILLRLFVILAAAGCGITATGTARHTTLEGSHPEHSTRRRRLSPDSYEIVGNNTLRITGFQSQAWDTAHRALLYRYPDQVRRAWEERTEEGRVCVAAGGRGYYSAHSPMSIDQEGFIGPRGRGGYPFVEIRANPIDGYNSIQEYLEASFACAQQLKKLDIKTT